MCFIFTVREIFRSVRDTITAAACKQSPELQKHHLTSDLISSRTPELRTLSSLFCQLSSLFPIRSMQWERVAKIPAVVALNVMASPLKSIPLMPLWLKHWNTDGERTNPVTLWNTKTFIYQTVLHRLQTRRNAIQHQISSVCFLGVYSNQQLLELCILKQI